MYLNPFYSLTPSGTCNLRSKNIIFQELVDKVIISIFSVWADRGECSSKNKPPADIQPFDSLQWPCKLLQSLRINSSHATPSPLPVVSGWCIVPLAPIHPEYQPSPTICRFPGRSWYLSISLPPHSKLPTLLSVHTLYPPHCGCFIHIVTQMKEWEREFFWTKANNVIDVFLFFVLLAVHYIIYLHFSICPIFLKHRFLIILGNQHNYSTFSKYLLNLCENGKFYIELVTLH